MHAVCLQMKTNPKPVIAAPFSCSSANKRTGRIPPVLLFGCWLLGGGVTAQKMRRIVRFTAYDDGRRAFAYEDDTVVSLQSFVSTAF